jgi:predicted ATPase
MVGDLIEMDSLNDDTAQRLVHDIDRVYQTVHDDLDDDTDIEL